MCAAEKRHAHDIHIEMDDGLDAVSEDSTVSEMTEEGDSSDEEDDDESGRMGGRHQSQEDVGDDSDALRWKSELWCGEIVGHRVLGHRVFLQTRKTQGKPIDRMILYRGPGKPRRAKSIGCSWSKLAGTTNYSNHDAGGKIVENGSGWVGGCDVCDCVHTCLHMC